MAATVKLLEPPAAGTIGEMRATRAYIASAGTAIVLLGASLATLALVSALVAFGDWPGTTTGSSVGRVFVSDAVKAKPKAIRVSADAVRVAQRDAGRQPTAQPRDPSARGRSATTRTVARSQVGRPAAPSPSTPTAGTPVDAAATTVRQQAQTVAPTVETTTRNVTTQVTQPVQNVANQVSAPVEQTTAPVDQQVQGTAGSLLPGH